MFHRYFLVFLHGLLDFRCFVIGAGLGAVISGAISGAMSLVSAGISAGMQAKQMKNDMDKTNKQMEQANKQLDFEKQKYNDNQKAQEKAGEISASALSETTPSTQGISGTIGSISDSAGISGGSSLGLENKETSFLRS